MKNNMVSVIVPNYNHGKYLRKRIDSILAQTYQDFELILLDDKSTDDSIDIIKSYQADVHVSHIVINDKNTGNPFYQWKKGIELSKGDLIWIAESDDIADKDFLMILISLMNSNPDAVIAFSHSFLIDEEGCQIDKDFHGHSNPDEVKVFDGEKFARYIMTTCNYIFNASMVLFKKSAFTNVSNTFMQYRTCGDWAFWMEICLQGKVIEVGKRLSCFRQHENKVTARAGQTGKDWLDVARLLTSFVSLLHLKGLPLMIYRGQWTKHFQESRFSDKQHIVKHYPVVFGGSWLDIIIYQLSKLYRKYIDRL